MERPNTFVVSFEWNTVAKSLATLDYSIIANVLVRMADEAKREAAACKQTNVAAHNSLMRAAHELEQAAIHYKTTSQLT